MIQAWMKEDAQARFAADPTMKACHYCSWGDGPEITIYNPNPIESQVSKPRSWWTWRLKKNS